MSTWYINVSGSDETGDGTLGNPYGTIQKGLDVAINGDTLRLIGNFTIDTTIIINKEVTIISDAENIYTAGVFIHTGNVFKIQSNNVSIRYLMLQVMTSPGYSVIYIDRMSTGNTEPTFWTGTVIDNCDIAYWDCSLELSGSFTVTNNTFGLQDEAYPVSIIKIYGTRGDSIIDNNNLLYASYYVANFIHLTAANDSGDYYDKCNSKGGTLTISNNTISVTNNNFTSNFVYVDYFNQYNFSTVAADEVYNPNTRISLLIHDNNLSYGFYSKTVYIDTKTDSDFYMFDLSKIYNNTNNNTLYGALHLAKTLSDESKITIDPADLNRPVFRVYDNTLSETIITAETNHWDASLRSSMRDSGDNELSINGELYRWIDSVNNVDIMNAGSYPAILETETRNNTTYNYVRTIMNVDGYLKTMSNIIKTEYVMYLVFREAECSHNVRNYINYINSDSELGYYSLRHNTGHGNIFMGKFPGVFNTDYFSSRDFVSDYCNARVYGIQYSGGLVKHIEPVDGDAVTGGVDYGIIRTITETAQLPLYLGNVDNANPSSICLYEIVIYKGIQTNEDMLNQYRALQLKWGIISNSVDAFHWDSSNASSIQDINGDPVTVGNPITRWVDSVGNVNMVNAGSYPATLETETRGGISYNYIKTVSNTAGYLISESGIIKNDYTMYLVFKEDPGSHEAFSNNVFINDDSGYLRSYHDNDMGSINNQYTDDIQVSSYSIRIWAIRVIGGYGFRCIFPSKGATSFGMFKNLDSQTWPVDIPNLSILKLGQSEDLFPTSLNIYELLIVNGAQTDNEMMNKYNELHTKWKVDIPSVPVKVFNYDASNSNSILDESGNPVVVGNPITKWVDNLSGVNMVNGGYTKALLESEERNLVTYNYIRNISTVNGFLGTVSGILKTGCTFYLVFREHTYNSTNGSTFMTDYMADLTAEHLRRTIYTGSMNSEDTNDYSSNAYTTRVWAMRLNPNTYATYITPANGDPTTPEIIQGTYYTLNIPSPRILYFGEMDYRFPSSVCLYEIIVYDGLQSDSEMLAEYNNLQIKWGIISPP